jgi:hypothetical protein
MLIGKGMSLSLTSTIDVHMHDRSSMAGGNDWTRYDIIKQ